MGGKLVVLPKRVFGTTSWPGSGRPICRRYRPSYATPKAGLCGLSILFHRSESGRRTGLFSSEDAAHAMPPQGESTGIVLEDGILLARCLMRQQTTQDGIKDAFNAYEKLRRTRINSAYRESQIVVNSVKDTGLFGHALKTWIIPLYLRFSRAGRERHFAEDVTNYPSWICRPLRRRPRCLWCPCPPSCTNG